MSFYGNDYNILKYFSDRPSNIVGYNEIISTLPIFQKITELLKVTPTRQMVNSVEELDISLEFFQRQLEEKEKELEISKVETASTEANLKPTFNDTAKM